MGNLETERIISRIKALLAKTTENGASKAEMESSLRKANQLMTEFFISEHDLKDPEIVEKCVSKSFEITKSGYDLGMFYNDLATLFDCECWYNKYYITFFGHSIDVELCGYFYAFITKSCLKEKDLYLKTQLAQNLKNYYHTKTISSSFIKGFIIEITIKMREMYEQRKSNIPESYGVMVVEKLKKVQLEYEALDLNHKIKYQPKLKGIKEAFVEGMEKGKDFQITQGIEVKNTELGKSLMYHE